MMSAPVARTSAGRMALTVPAVPTGMKAGVRISPRSMEMVPVRALPSVAAILNVNRAVIANAHSILLAVGKRLVPIGCPRYDPHMGHNIKQLHSLATALILAGAVTACGDGLTEVKFDAKDRGLTMPEPKRAAREKCYGIAIAQYNDCAAGAGTDCAGTAAKDHMPDRWKYVPTGSCAGLGGSLKAGKALK